MPLFWRKNNAFLAFTAGKAYSVFCINYTAAAVFWINVFRINKEAFLLIGVIEKKITKKSGQLLRKDF